MRAGANARARRGVDRVIGVVIIIIIDKLCTLTHIQVNFVNFRQRDSTHTVSGVARLPKSFINDLRE